MKNLDVARCMELIERIRFNTEALHWLQTEAEAVNFKDKSHIDVVVHPRWAGACRGAKEAGEVLTAFTRARLAEVFIDAKTNCINSIELDRAALLQEVSDA